MKNTLALVGMILVMLGAGCVSLQDSPKYSWDKDVALAEKEWASYIKIQVVPPSDIFAVDMERRIYQDALRSGDETHIHLAARNLINLIYTLMIPPFPEG